MAAGLARRLSPTALFAWLAAPFESLHRRSKGEDRLYATLPGETRAELGRLLEPAVARLEAQRQETVAAVDSVAIRAMPAALLAGGALTLVSGQGLALALAVGAGLALAAFWLVQLRPAANYVRAARASFGSEVAAYLSDFEYYARTAPDLRRIGRWKLFPRVLDPLMDDYMTGSRDGRQVALYRLGITYREAGGRAGSARRLTAVCVEAETGPGCTGAVVLLPRWANAALRAGPAGTHGLLPVAACDGALEPEYEVFAESPSECGLLLNPAMCDRIRALAGRQAALHPDRIPVLVFLPGYLAALFPLRDGVALFTPPPFWRPLDPQATLAQLAADLATKHAILMETLELGPNGLPGPDEPERP